MRAAWVPGPAGAGTSFIGVFTGSVTNTFGERLPLTFSIVSCEPELGSEDRDNITGSFQCDGDFNNKICWCITVTLSPPELENY